MNRILSPLHEQYSIGENEEITSSFETGGGPWDLPFEFCRESSLHGLRFVGQPKRHIVERYDTQNLLT
jgi:hypothetical protein